MRRRQLLIAPGAALLVACGAAAEVPPPGQAQPARREPRLDVWPTPYLDAPRAVRDAYAYASVNYATLRYVPCYCGCGEQGQRNNGDCFVREAREGSWVELDPHGFACGTCVGVALDAKDLAARGMSVRAIGTAIDAKWAKTGPSTPTAMP